MYICGIITKNEKCFLGRILCNYKLVGMKHDVYISYKSELIELVEKFANNLENQIVNGNQIRC